MRRSSIIAIAAACAAAAAVGVTRWTGSAGPAGTGGTAESGSPSPVTGGEFAAPVYTVDGARDRGLRLAAAEESEEAFAGFVGDLYLYTPPASPPRDAALGGHGCAPADLRWVEPSGSAVLPVPRSMPPGAIARGEGSAVSCRGRIVFSSREFELRPYGVIVTIARAFGQRFVEIPRAGRDRVGPGTIAGRPASLVRPLTPEGFGSSAIAWREGDDVMRVTGLDLPFAELVRIAESVA